MARKPHSYHYIYKTTCKINGKYYIGMHSTSNLEDGYIGSGKRLWNSIRNHGRENHEIEILEWFPDRSSLKDREKQLVNESLLQDPMCMNLALGGEGGFINKEAAASGGRATCIKNGKKAREQFSLNMKDPDYCKVNVEKIKKTNLERTGSANGWKGKTHSNESKKKIGEKNSISQKGSRNSQFGTHWIYNTEHEISKKILKTEEIPDGWTIGRKMNKKINE